MNSADTGFEPQLFHSLVSDGQARTGGVVVRHDDEVTDSRLKIFKTPKKQEALNISSAPAY